MKKLLLLATIALVACKEEATEEGGQQKAAFVMPPPHVSYIVAKTEKLELTTKLPGKTIAFKTADVRPQISALIKKRIFTEGVDVKAGATLYQLDDATLQTAVQSAKTAVASAQGLKNRYQNLIASQAISKQAYDDANSALQQAQQQLKQAQIALDYAKVTAPISGRIGKSNFDEGALVAPSGLPLVSIQQLNPILVDISQSTKDVLSLRRDYESGLVDAQKGKVVVELELEDGSIYEQKGELQFTDMQVHETTGTVSLRAKFPNDKLFLLPGMLVQANLKSGTVQNAILIPQEALSSDQTGKSFVYKVNEANVVEQAFVQVKKDIANKWWITEGISEGDKIIVEGFQKMKIGGEAIATEFGVQQEGLKN